MPFKSAEEIREVAERVNYENSPIELYKKHIMNQIVQNSNKGLFECEILCLHYLGKAEESLDNLYPIIQELRDAGYKLSYKPKSFSKVTTLVISWSGHES